MQWIPEMQGAQVFKELSKKSNIRFKESQLKVPWEGQQQSRDQNYALKKGINANIKLCPFYSMCLKSNCDTNHFLFLLGYLAVIWPS